MSDDGLSDYFDEPSMEIQIKTLMGTSFDMKVYSTDTIGDIKKKIYRVEGIPIYQQNLIFQSKELKDTNRLCDAGIRHGSSLALVTSMRGGPISTRRLSVACEHHVMLKELKELLENTSRMFQTKKMKSNVCSREDLGEKLSPGSKVSVLVFKEGDIINLLRVIENEDGSYSPYSEKPISPPSKPPRKESHVGIFERLVEDDDMSTKVANLRKKMSDVNIRKMAKNSKTTLNDQTPKTTNDSMEEKAFGESEEKNLSYQFLSECASNLMKDFDMTIFEKNVDDENNSETEEIALKDKHRTKPRFSKNAKKSIYSENKGEFSHARQNYARMHKKTRDLKFGEGTSRERKSPDFLHPDDTEDIKLQPYSESLTVAARNRVHLTRLVLSDSADRPKSGPDSIELEENAQDLWEFHEPAAERLKHSATCKVGLLKRRQSLDYGGFTDNPNVKNEINYCKNAASADYAEVCSGYNYHMPSAIPPQYAPKDQGLCDYYFSSTNRSPLYGRKSSSAAEDEKPSDVKQKEKFNFLGECSSIQRLKNDEFGDNLFSTSDEIDNLYGYYNLGCSAEFLNERPVDVKKEKDSVKLPPVVKKRSRCGECNKKLNITNIYDCRCGRIFCAQHRHSEVHRCTYDYKTEGRKILERQNPLVAAEKVNRI
ncbi:unnamed protein product [Brassicogethes aeneus]|uniref:AN1-type zinc finger protein 4 n=1 Tax=Brassicogethes aeneus TaxID=1431903 RepID=A0A9P0FNA2_BRAAE|nr:unnamed protein product [Brassicogethes aeneus]